MNSHGTPFPPRFLCYAPSASAAWRRATRCSRRTRLEANHTADAELELSWTATRAFRVEGTSRERNEEYFRHARASSKQITLESRLFYGFQKGLDTSGGWAYTYCFPNGKWGLK
jgi:hypothetical protein